MASRPALVLGDDGLPQRLQPGDSLAGNVSYGVAQSLTVAQQAQARGNIGAAGPRTAFGASKASIGLPGSGGYQSALSVSFVATASAVLIIAQCNVSTPSNTATEVDGYIRLNDASSSGTLAVGQTQGTYLTTTAGAGGNLNPTLVATGLVVGDTYQVDLMMSSTGTTNTTATNIALGGVCL